MSRQWDNPKLLDAMRKALDTGETDESVAKRFGVNGTTASRARIFVEGERSARGKGGSGRPRGRVTPLNWNHMTPAARLRALKERRKHAKMTESDAYLHLTDYQMQIARLCTLLEGARVEEFGLDEVSIWHISDLQDDLISLADWVDRTLSAISGRLEDGATRAKIAALRETSGRTAEEIASMKRVADKLERKLRNRLAARAGEA